MLSIEVVDENHAVGCALPTVICIWRHDTTVEAIRGLGAVADRFHRQNQGALMTVVELGAFVPSAAARAELARTFEILGDTIACSALVFEGDGFRAAAVRAIATTISQVSRSPFPHRVFSSIEQAGEWMETYSIGISSSQLVSDVGHVRNAMDGYWRGAV